jgi:hypothetical protein
MISIAPVIAATCAQSEPDTISAVAAHATKRGIAANGLTQRNALRAWSDRRPIPRAKKNIHCPKVGGRDAYKIS